MYLRRRSTRSSLCTTYFTLRCNANQRGRVEPPDSHYAVLRERLREWDRPRRRQRRSVEELRRKELDWGRVCRQRHLTAACRLVSVHEVIGGGEQRFVGAAVIREHRCAGARAEPQPLAGAHFHLDLGDAGLQLSSLRL